MIWTIITHILFAKLALLSAPFLIALGAVFLFAADFKRLASIAGVVAIVWFGAGAAYQKYEATLKASYAAGDAAGAARIQMQFDAFKDQLAEVSAEEARRQDAINAEHAAETKAAADALDEAESTRDKEIAAYGRLLAHDEAAQRAARAFDARDVGELQRILGQAVR